MSEAKKSRLFMYGTLEPKDHDLDERLEKCYGDLSGIMSRLRENELFNHLNDKVSRSAQDHEDVSMALLYAILTEPSSAAKTYTTLNLVSRDSLSAVTSQAERIIMEKTPHLQDHARVQVLWLTGEMVKTGVAGADKLCFALLKQLPAGSTQPGELYIAENLMHILLDNREWMDSQPGLISSVVYTYLSLLPFHVGPTLANLKEQEAHMCISLIRTRFTEYMQIGRDLLRLLQAVARIPDFTDLWRDLMLHPQKIGPQCVGVAQMLSRRTSRRFIAGRILVDIEIKLNFLLSKVKFGQHKKYQEWFQKKYLSTPDSLHQIPELIRFICCVIHPTNEVLASDIIPRWALIGWLLSLCQSNLVVFNNAKLALFYDWLAYNPDSDNIMNIEPGILLMHHSMRAHPQITASLLDFLCRMVANYYPSQEQVVEIGMKAALRDILQKGVLHSLEPLFQSSRWDEELRQLVRKIFPEFCRQAGRSPAPESQLATPTSTEVLEIGGGVVDEEEGVVLSWGQGGGDSANDPLVISSNDDLEGEDSEVITAFSDPEDEGDEGKDTESALNLQRPSPEFTSANSQGFLSISAGWEEDQDSKDGSTSSSTLWSRVEELPEGLKEKMILLKSESNLEVQSNLLDDVLKLLEEICQEDAEESQSTIDILAAPLSVCLAEELSEGCEREGKEEQEDTTNTALTHCMFRSMLATPPPDSAHPLAVALSSNQPRLGYFYLNYLSRHTTDGSLEPYTMFTDIFEGLSLRECLVKDLKVCVEHEPGVFYYLLPSLYHCFSKHLFGCQDVLYLIVSNIDPAQLHNLIHRLMTKEFQLFGKQPADIKNLIAASLQWDSFEQFCVWQLLSAEGSDPSLIIPILADLNTQDHPEAMSSALLYLKNESSGYAAINTLLSLPVHLSDLVDAIASRWLTGRPTKCAKLLSQHLENLDKSGEEDSREAIKTLLLHLQRLIKSMNSKQVLEASEYAVSKTLHKLFKNDPDLTSDFSDLNKAISSTPGEASTKKEGSSHKRPGSSSSTSGAMSSGEKSTKHSDQPKAKRRRVTNKDDLIDS